MVGTKIFLSLSVFLCLTDTVVSVVSKCRVASFRVIGSMTNSCDIQFGYMTAPPDWIDQLEVVGSFRNASERQLDALAKDVCRCRMLRVHRHCPSELFDLIKSVAWRCFPGARDAVQQGIAGTVMRQGHHGIKKSSGDHVHQEEKDESGNWELQSHGNSSEINGEEDTDIEESGSEEMSTTDSENVAIDGSTGSTEGTDFSGDSTTVESVDIIDENGGQSIEENPESSSGHTTQTQRTPKGLDTKSSEYGLEGVTENSGGKIPEYEEFAGDSEDGIDTTTNAGSGDFVGMESDQEALAEALGETV